MSKDKYVFLVQFETEKINHDLSGIYKNYVQRAIKHFYLEDDQSALEGIGIPQKVKIIPIKVDNKSRIKESVEGAILCLGVLDKLENK